MAIYSRMGGDVVSCQQGQHGLSINGGGMVHEEQLSKPGLTCLGRLELGKEENHAAELVRT